MGAELSLLKGPGGHLFGQARSLTRRRVVLGGIGFGPQLAPVNYVRVKRLTYGLCKPYRFCYLPGVTQSRVSYGRAMRFDGHLGYPSPHTHLFHITSLRN